MIQILDELLKKRGLTYEELTEAEKETYRNWLETIEKKTISLEDIKEHIQNMKAAVAAKLVETDEKDKEPNIYLKARLKNYLLLEELLNSPDKARRALERYVDSQSDG